MSKSPHVRLVDTCLLGSLTPSGAQQLADPAAPGALLPAGFPTAGYSEDQLCELEEWYLLASHTALLRFFYLTRTTRDGGEPTYKSVLYCCAILAKLFGFNPGQSWACIARQLGTTPVYICQLKRAILDRMRRSRGPATRHELRQAAARMRRRARQFELAAALPRKSENRNS